MNIVLAPDGPLHAGATLARYHLWGEDPANRLADGALLRVLRYHGRLVPYAVRAMKFSRRKGEYIRDLARAVVCGRLDLDALAAAPSEAVIERLTQQRGFGRCTADWFLARCLGRGDVCAAGDLGVRRAFEHFYGRGRTRSEEAIRRRARAWGEYQNLAVHYLLAGMRLARRAAGGG